MINKDSVIQLVETFLEGTDNYLISIEIKPGNIIIVEIDNDESVKIDDCILLSRFIESKLDRDIEDYELEVGSSGITQPFKILRQYRKNIGNEVEVLTRSGQKYSGILKDAEEKEFVITVEKQIKPDGAKRKVTIEEDIPLKYDETKYTKNIIRFK